MCSFERVNIFWLQMYHSSVIYVQRNVLIFTDAQALLKSYKVLKPFIIISSVLLLDLGRLR